MIRKKNIAIYGLSVETEKEISRLQTQYNVIGLLDSYTTEGSLYGYPIVSFEEAIKWGVQRIIVVARPGSCKAIAKRIGALCKEHNVPLFDIRGNDLLAETKVVYDFKSVNGYTKADILDKVNQVEVVSFDLFDTLVVRDVLSSSDVISLLNARLIEKGISINDFVKNRIATEKELSRGYAPRLEEIYENVLNSIPGAQVNASELAELEYDTDIALLRPRKDVVELLLDIKKSRKRVYITSESFYSKEQILKILELNGITNIDGLLVSCEYNTGKTGDLFDRLIDVAGTRNILHIGDDIVADIESPYRHGIQAFQIYSASELLDRVGGLNLLNDEMSLSERIRVGMFIANIFNSPFQFEDEERRIHVDDVYDIGYLFAAPVIMDFTKWFGEQVDKYELSNIWFCSRDGYLLQKLYELIYSGSVSEYFLTSRISAIRAGVESISDIEYVDSMKYSGDVEKNLKTRFGIDDSILMKYEADYDQSGLLKYIDVILSESKKKKSNVNKYIQKLNIKDGGIAFFDFVSKGTSQMFINRFVDNKIKGLYFLWLEQELMRDKNLDILAFYSEEEKDSSAIFDNYYILETLLTAPYPSLDEFDSDGNPVYAKETRTNEDIECFMRAQKGIIGYAERYLAICPENEFFVNKKLDESFLSLIHNIEIIDEKFLSLTVEDPFFNRMTDITDVL